MNVNMNNNDLQRCVNTFITLFSAQICTYLHCTTQHYMYIIRRSRRQFLNRLLRFLLTQNETSYQFLNMGPIPMLRISMERSLWMKPRSSDWWDRVVQQHFDDKDWCEYFRMRKQTFHWLCEQLRELLNPSENDLKHCRESLTVEKQVAIALCHLASCAEYRRVAVGFGVHKTTVGKCVHRVVNAIIRKLMPTHLNMPDDVECETIARHFEKTTHIPQLIGAIDGTHIPILPPSDGYRDYVNRKGWPSIVLQAVVDHTYRFRKINCQAPGCSHDAAVFKNSKLFKKHQNIIPQNRKQFEGCNIPYMIKGDPAYPLLPWLLKGYTKSARLTPEEESFNVYLNSGRVCVEIAFGRLKARWRCLLKRIDLHFTFVPRIVAACCILHNIVETHKEPFMQGWEEPVLQAELEFPHPTAEVNRTYDNYDAHHIRDILKNYLSERFCIRQAFHTY